ncbi:MAG TPA: hypothetical protein PKE16_18285 [Hyphomicrobium sp.]|nr:hypothetical protein [Hyphomicrobium sp.]
MGAVGARSGELSSAAAPSVGSDNWSFVFTTYGWVPWLTGNTVIKGRSFDVAVDPSDLFGHLDWSTLPAWMSYAEARRGPIGLFNDIVYANLSGSRGFARERQNATFSGDVSADYTQVTIETGGAYEIWAGQNPVASGTTAVDALAGARYWHQDAVVSANTLASGDIAGLEFENGRWFARSGSVDWVDPFVGVRLRNQLGPGEQLVIRADVGGFGVGSNVSWQVLATYNWQMCVLYGHILDGYVGYRALSVDYSQGSGTSKYEYDVLQQGPVIGSTLHF